jgi:DNA-binding transcriptional LysR family regulator
MDSRSGEMLVFTKVVESGSFSAAGEVLNLTPSAVSKLVTRIEERLGVRLFQRSTRHMETTPEGTTFYESCVRILEDIEEAEQNVAQGSAVPRGVLRVNASLPFGTHQLLPLIAEFAKRYPEITVDLSLSDAMADLQRDRIDVAIRMGPLIDANFRARLLGRSRRAVVATPSYIEAHGAPAHPDDLVGHPCFNFSFRRSVDEWPFSIDGKVVLIPVRGGMLTNNGETMRDLALRGLGVARLGLFHVAEDIRAGMLVELLSGFNPGDVEEINAIFLNQRFMPLRVRAFIDFLAERISPKLAELGDAAGGIA